MPEALALPAEEKGRVPLPDYASIYVFAFCSMLPCMFCLLWRHVWEEKHNKGKACPPVKDIFPQNERENVH